MSDRPKRYRRTVLRTLGTLGTGAIAAVTTAGAAAGAPPDHAAAPAHDRPSNGASSPIDGDDLYLGVVDRIVDGDHVVLLLEDGESVVDQLVLPAERFVEMAPDDVFLTAVTDDELRAYRRLPSKPTDCPQARFDRLSEEL